jgi:cytochrome c5
MLQRKTSLALALVLIAALVVPAIAQDTTKQPSAAQAAQQQKMKDCNAQAAAKSLKGDDRKTFMSTCLSGSTK